MARPSFHEIGRQRPEDLSGGCVEQQPGLHRQFQVAGVKHSESRYTATVASQGAGRMR